MDTKASTLDPALLHLVTEMNLYGTVYSCNRTVRRWRLCPLRRSEGRYRPLHAVFGAGSRAFRDYANCIASDVIATGRSSSSWRPTCPTM